MSKSFYAGGFIYDPALKQILLHKRDDKTINNPDSWAFFGGLSEKEESPETTFRREVEEEIGVKLSSIGIKKLTGYFNNDFNTHRHVFYAEIELTDNLLLSEGEAYGWFTLQEAMKLKLTKRTRQDLFFFQKKIDLSTYSEGVGSKTARSTRE